MLPSRSQQGNQAYFVEPLALRSGQNRHQDDRRYSAASATSPYDHPMQLFPGRDRPRPTSLLSTSTYAGPPPPNSSDFLLGSSRSDTFSTQDRRHSDTSTVYDPFLEYDRDQKKSAPLEYNADFLRYEQAQRVPTSGFYSHFEPTDWRGIAMHAGFCFVGYPFLLLVCLAASNKTLFWARVIVGIGCGLLGFCLGLNPYRFARRYLEAGSM